MTQKPNPYPDRIGVLSFVDGTYEVDINTPDVAPNCVYIKEESLSTPAPDAEAEKITAAYKRYPDLVLDGISPDEVAKMFEMAVLLNTEYAQKSFVHKMLLQGAHCIRQLKAAQSAPVVSVTAYDLHEKSEGCWSREEFIKFLMREYPDGLKITAKKREG
jgi:hypothetical protein